VLLDPITGKWTLIGIFNTLGARDLPFISRPFHAYALLADLHGNVDIRFRLVDPDDVRLLEAVVPSVRVQEGITLDCGGGFPPILFNREGPYAIWLIVNGEIAGVHTLSVQRSTPQVRKEN
jgi:hypothetical protein